MKQFNEMVNLYLSFLKKITKKIKLKTKLENHLTLD